MRLENYITHGEYLYTIELAYKVKKIYGINAYFLFKKICMVAACKAGTTVETDGGFTSYITYNVFLSTCSHHIFHMLDISTLFYIRKKYEMGEDFFGVPTAYIYDFNVLELDEFLTKPRSMGLLKQ